MLTLENFKEQWERKFPDISLKHTHFLLAVSGGLDSVGLTYMNRRIEWPFQVLDKKRSAIWIAFVADSLAKNSYSELSKISVFSNQEL